MLRQRGFDSFLTRQSCLERHPGRRCRAKQLNLSSVLLRICCRSDGSTAGTVTLVTQPTSAPWPSSHSRSRRLISSSDRNAIPCKKVAILFQGGATPNPDLKDVRARRHQVMIAAGQHFSRFFLLSVSGLNSSALFNFSGWSR